MGELSTMFIANARSFIAVFYGFTNERGLKAIIYICLIKIPLNGRICNLCPVSFTVYIYSFCNWHFYPKPHIRQTFYQFDLHGKQTYDFAFVSAMLYCLWISVKGL